MRRILIPIILLLLLTPVFADDCYRVNAPDAGYAARLADAAQRMGEYYQGDSVLFDATTHDPLAYPAALFYFSRQGFGALGNQILEKEVATATPLENDDALYLSWLLKKYGTSEFLYENVKANATTLLNAYLTTSPEASSPEEQFEQNVAHYLADGSRENALLTTLRTTGDAGWPGDIEQSPSRYAKIVTALFALYDEAPSNVMRKLAEMQLDLAFTLYGAAQSGSAWVTPTSDVTFETGAFTPEKTPWAGWGYLLLGMGDSYLVVTEPSALVSGYTTHQATRLAATAEERIVREATKQGALLQSYHTAKYAIGASQDVAGKVFTKPYTYKAWLFMNEEPHSFLLLTSRSSDESGTSDNVTLERTVLFNDHIMLGSLGSDDCREPHALFGEGFIYSILSNGKGFVFSYGDGQIGIISFPYSINPLQVTERYALRANKLPEWLTGPSPDATYDKKDAGLLLIPNGGGASTGFFALEMLRSNAKIVQDCQEDINCIAEAAPGNMSLAASGNTLTYTTKLSGTPRTYTYNRGGQATSGGAPLSLNDYSLRHVLGENGYEYLQKKGNTWLLEASGAGQVHLDFSATTPERMKRIDGYPDGYVCEGADGELPPAVASSDELPDLGFAAASFLSNLANNDYIIDCAEGTSVLPNAVVDPENELVNGACVILTPREKSVALVWNPEYTGAPVLETIFQNLNNYFPFADSGTGLSVREADRNICNDASSDTFNSTDFEKCSKDLQVANSNKGLPSYTTLHLWVNGQQHVLVISTDSNPFTSGWWSDGIGDWWSSLFGSGIVSGVDPVNVSDFKAAYFFKDGDRSIHALLDRQENGEVLFKNFRQSMAPFASNAQISYDAGGTTQSLRFTSPSAEKGTTWSILTRAFRVDTSITGTPFTTETTCGNGKVEYGEECDPPGSSIGKCTVGDLTKNVTCSASCTLNESACGACEDRDRDGEPGPGCDGIEHPDCLDADPAGYYVYCNAVRAEALGASCSDGIVSCEDFSFGDGDCNEYPTAACPQCVRHNDPDNDIEINDICDGVDNDCSGSADPGCPTSSGGSDDERWTCGNEVSGTSTPPTSSSSSSTLPSEWTAFFSMGAYTFSMRNHDGVPQLKIHASGAVIDGKTCDWGRAPDHSKTADWIINWTGVAGTRTLIFQSGDDPSASKVFVEESAQGWVVNYEQARSIMTGSCITDKKAVHCWRDDDSMKGREIPVRVYLTMNPGNVWHSAATQGKYTFAVKGSTLKMVPSSVVTNNCGWGVTTTGRDPKLFPHGQQPQTCDPYDTACSQNLIYQSSSKVDHSARAFVWDLNQTHDATIIGWNLFYYHDPLKCNNKCKQSFNCFDVDRWSNKYPILHKITPFRLFILPWAWGIYSQNDEGNPNPESGKLLSEHGLTCEYTSPGPRIKVGTIGTYTVREYYFGTNTLYAKKGDPAIVLDGSNDAPACNLFGLANQWHIRDAAKMHYSLTTTSFDGGGMMVNVQWPYPFWTSVIGPTPPWYKNPLTYQSPIPNAYVEIVKSTVRGAIRWNLKATIKSTATQQEMQNFVTCWYDGDVEDIKTDGSFDPGKIQTWANTAFPAFNDTMATPCEAAPADPVTTVPTDCPNICAIVPQCAFECNADNCEACASTPGCIPSQDCAAFDDCGSYTKCPTGNECTSSETCSAGCCFPSSGGTGHCFPSGTMVATPEGATAIDALAVGDQVIAYDPVTKEERAVPVLKLFTSTDEKTLILINDELFVTPSHPFYSRRGWLPAGELVVGDELLTQTGWVTVDSLTRKANSAPVYNIEVDGPHTFYAAGYLVHNKAGE